MYRTEIHQYGSTISIHQKTGHRPQAKKNYQNSSQLDHRTIVHALIAHNQFIRKPNRKPKQKKLQVSYFDPDNMYTSTPKTDAIKNKEKVTRT
jgi:hypothetical protein